MVAQAVRFDIAPFLGVGRYATETAATLEEALATADHRGALGAYEHCALSWG